MSETTTPTETDEQALYIIRDDGGRYVIGALDVFLDRGLDFDVVDSQETAEAVAKRRPSTTSYAPDVHESTLKGRAVDAAEEIAAGEHDDALDVLLWAERFIYDDRTTVVDAILKRAADTAIDVEAVPRRKNQPAS